MYNPRILQLNTPGQLRAELERVGAESSIAALRENMARATFRVVKLSGVSLTLARFLYQELVMEGGQVVTAAGLEHVGEGTTDVLLCGTRYQLDNLLARLRWQPSDELVLLADELDRLFANSEQPPAPLPLGPLTFEWGRRTYIMGILNVTPDSFSGDGLIRPGDTSEQVVERALERARRMAADGADILDIGGESTHPAAEPVPADVELARVVPVVERLAKEVSIPLSIDTYKAAVARAALSAGAVLVNDVWGLRRDPEIKQVVAASGAAVVLNHNWLGRGPVERVDFIGDIISELRALQEEAVEAGIAEERVIVDPGLGFGKTLGQNLELLDHLGELRALGRPILVGPSRKGFIRRALGLPRGQEDEGTAAAVAVGIARGADIVRVHDVKAIKRVAQMTDRIARASGAQVDK